jgi:branched-chain amino acid transport system substrate-binding protein
MRIRSFVMLAVAASLVACFQGVGPASTPAVRVVVIQDGSFPDAGDLVSPAVLGLQLALSQLPSVQLEILDTGGDPARTADAARSVAADPSVVAAVIAPFTAMPDEALGSLTGSGLPVLSLSSLSEAPPRSGPPPSWRPFVAPVSVMAHALVQVAGDLRGAAPVCMFGDETAWSNRVQAEIEGIPTGVRVRSVTVPLDQSGEAIAAAGCGTAVWTGTATGADALADAMRGTVPLVVDDAARTDGYLVARWPGTSTTLAVCSCADLSTSKDLDAQRFVHDFQASTGLDAGPFAVEGFDVGTWILRALEGGATREHIAARLASANRFDGLARTYRWDDRGSMLDQGMRAYRGAGLRWLVAPESQRAL